MNINAGAVVAPTLDIVIVNWNSGDQLCACLQSIVGADRTGFTLKTVVVVDNASTDGSLDGLPMAAIPLRIIANAVNRGFGVACNQGAAGSNADFLLFLNPDTRLFAASLAYPMAFMMQPSSQKVGICGIQLVDEQGHVARSCANFPTLSRFAAHVFAVNRVPRWASTGVHMGGWDHLTTRHVDHVIGAYFMIRRVLFVELGGFDERFFVYLEDLDVSFRVRVAGWNSTYLSGVQAFHAGGGTSRNVKSARLFYSLRSRLLYGFKHFSRIGAWLLVGLTLLIEPITRTFLACLHLNRSELLNMWKAYLKLYGALPEIVRVGRNR